MYELKQVLEVPITEVRMELDNYKKQQTPQVSVDTPIDSSQVENKH